RVTVPYLGDDGEQMYEVRYIDTRKLLLCKSDAAREILLDQMASQGSEILKMLSDQSR
ncbi:hypothetical protein A2U01_0069809, partial [Trifolium medium]|nr:hypothetical protein [Trifolium medium]